MSKYLIKFFFGAWAGSAPEVKPNISASEKSTYYNWKAAFYGTRTSTHHCIMGLEKTLTNWSKLELFQRMAFACMTSRMAYHKDADSSHRLAAASIRRCLLGTCISFDSTARSGITHDYYGRRSSLSESHRADHPDMQNWCEADYDVSR